MPAPHVKQVLDFTKGMHLPAGYADIVDCKVGLILGVFSISHRILGT